MSNGFLSTWERVHAGILFILTFAYLILGVFGIHHSGKWIIPAILILGTVSFLLLWSRENKLRPADAVTFLRVLFGWLMYLLLLLADKEHPGVYWTAAALVAAGEVSDFFDGALARRKGGTSFGARWDMEIDAFWMLLISALLVGFLGLPVWILFAGFFRYLFYFIFLLFPVARKISPSKAFSWYAKTVCPVAALLLGTMFILLFSYSTKVYIGMAAVGLLGSSFLWETFLRAGFVEGSEKEER